MTTPMHSVPTPPRSRDLVTDDGEPMESARHRQQMEVLIQSLELAWADRNDFYAGGNMFLYSRPKRTISAGRISFWCSVPIGTSVARG